MTVGRIIRTGPTANEILRARAVRHAVYFQRLRTHEVHQIIGILNRDVYPELGAKLTAALRDALLTGEQLTASAERLLRMQELTAQLIRAGLATVRDTLSEDLQSIAMAEAEWQVVTLAQATPIEWDFTTPSPSTLRALVTGDPLGADPISGWFDDITASARDLVSKQIRTGIAGGETVDQLVHRVIGTGGLVDRNRHQVEAVVRTSCTDVAARARAQTYQDNADIVKGYQFVATLDARTTLICASNDGKEFPNSDTEHMPPLHPNCLPGDRLVSTRSKIASHTERWFDGNLCIIRTASGRELAATPNHPVLTNRGWVAIAALNRGDHVVSHGIRDRARLGRMHHHDVPSRIEDVAEALRESRRVTARPVPLAAEDFHGDAANGDVAVVWSDRFLRDALESGALEPVKQIHLVGRPHPRTRVGFSGGRTLAEFFHRCLASSNRIVRRRGESPTLLRACSPHPRKLLFAAIAQSNALRGEHALHWARRASEVVSDAAHSNAFAKHLHDALDGQIDARLRRARAHLDTAFRESTEQRRGADAKRAREILHGAAGPVFLDEVVHVERRKFSGHVFNLETESGFYVADGVIVHNCRSTTTPVLRGWQELGIAGLRELPAGARASLDGEVADTTTFGEWLKGEPKAVQDEVLGPTRGDLFRAGKFEVSEFVDQSGRKYTLAELAARDAMN